jgi:hypothetical protein
LQQVGCFLQVLRFPPPIIKLTTTMFTEILLKVALNTITLILHKLKMLIAEVVVNPTTI